MNDDYRSRWRRRTMQRLALEWLQERGGDGVFARDGRLLAAGDFAPFPRSTWEALAENAKVEFYGGARNCARLRLKEG